MQNVNASDGLPQATREKLLAFRRLVRQIKIAEGFLSGLFGLIVSWLFVFIADRFFDTPSGLRTLALILGAVGPAVVFPWKCHHWVWGTRTFEQVAVLLRRKYPTFGDQLLGVVDLARQRAAGRTSALADAAIQHVDTLVQKNDFHSAVPQPRHRRWAVAVLVPIAICLVAWVAAPSAARNAVFRWLTPWRPVDRFTFTQFQSLPPEIVVPQGEPFALHTELAPSSEWAPATATLSIGQREPISVERREQSFDFEVPPHAESIDAELSAGDYRTVIRVLPTARPEMKSLQAQIELPEYLQQKNSRTLDARSGVVTVVKGSKTQFVGEVSRSLAEASVDGRPAEVRGTQIQIAGGVFDQPSVLQVTWQDQDGLEPSQPFQLKVNVIDDGSPVVSCLQQEPALVVMTTDVISFDISADDDFGLRQVGLEWKGIPDPLSNPNPQDGEKLVAGGSPDAGRMKVVGTFCADSDRMQPQAIQLRAWAEDFNPNGQRSYSPSIQLHVLTPQDHAVWVAEQLRRWASRADDIYEEELRLHETNRQIRASSLDERATPEMQSTIAQQIEGEQANAARLSAITQQGRELIGQALRNREMHAEHLEIWAQSLQQLEAISGNRMPAVMDLLKAGQKQALQASNAAASAPGSSNPATQPAAEDVGNNRNQSAAPQEGAEPKKPEDQQGAGVPSITDVESGFLKDEAEKDEDGKDEEKSGDKTEDEKKQASAGGLSLPSTQLMGGPQRKETESNLEDAPQPDAVEQAVEEQERLLMEFEKVRDDLQSIMDDLENSTFVKRLKAASRRQLEIAGDLNRTLFSGFGVAREALSEDQSNQLAAIAVREEEQSKFVWAIQADLEAYLSRTDEEQFARVHEQMKKSLVVEKLGEIGTRVRSNLAGESISRAEYWADTLDRWGEEVVAPSKAGSQDKDKDKNSQGASLPPAIVLEVMRILEGEIDLREETRSLEQLRSSVEEKDILEQSSRQSATQGELRRRAQQVMLDIEALPDGEEKFARELLLIGQASFVMQEVERLLLIGLTGPQTIGAETEIIELLLQSKRSSPKGGGGAGGTAPGKGGEGSTEDAALALLGPGSDPNAKVDQRGVQQATGEVGEPLPEEFREGLDAFFDAVEIGRRTPAGGTQGLQEK